MKTALLRPGILVSLKTTVSGGVSYRRQDLDATEAAQAASVGAAVCRWETTREIVDPAEHERACKARSAATVAIRAQCAKTTFGLLCPESREANLDEAIAAARAIVDAHNATATYTRVDVYTLKGRVASSDEEAARAIASEVRSLLDEMSAGMDKLDPGAIRDAAARARQMASMLGDDQVTKVNAAIESARTAARDIVRRVEKNGEAAAAVLADMDRGAIASARIAFLDLDTIPCPAMEETPALPAVELHRFDFDHDEPTITGTASMSAEAGLASADAFAAGA